MSELLGCPFCGKPAIESWSRDNEVVNIRCSNWRSNVCLGAGPNSYNLDEAIAAWNRRAQPSSEPVAYEFQHEDRGDITFIDPQQVEWGFEKNNPRWQLIGPVYRHPQPTDSAALRDAAIAELVRRKMTSGNSVPVERCIITAAEIAAIAQQEAP